MDLRQIDHNGSGLLRQAEPVDMKRFEITEVLDDAWYGI